MPTKEIIWTDIRRTVISGLGMLAVVAAPHMTWPGSRTHAAETVTETILLATCNGEQGDLLKLDGRTLQAIAAYRPGYWPRIASLLPLPDDNVAVIPFKDDKPARGNRASVHLVNTADFNSYGDAAVAGTITHDSAEPSNQGGATGGMVNRFGEVFLYAPSGRFHNFDGAMTVNGLDPQLPALETALGGYYERFVPDAGSALHNGDWVLVMTRPFKAQADRPGRVELRKRHAIRTRMKPAAIIDSLPQLTTSTAGPGDRIAVGDIEGNVYEIQRTDDTLVLAATREAKDLAGEAATVGDIAVTVDGDWIVAINSTGNTSGSGSVWVLEPQTLNPLHRRTGLAPIGAVAAGADGGVLIGTQSGALLVYDATLTKCLVMADGFDPITHVVVLPETGERKESSVTSQRETPASTGVSRHPNWVNALQPDGEPGPPITLARDGQSETCIVCAAEPTPQDVKAATDLAHWLHTMTGASFPLLREDPSREDSYVLLGVGRNIRAAVDPETFISIGRTRLAARAEIHAVDLQAPGEAYSIIQHGHGLYLQGGRTRGTINAVYALLEEDLGCRWYTAQATSIPFRPTLPVRPVSRSYAPALVDRRDPYYTEAQYRDWSLRNRTLGIHIGIPTDWGGYPKPLAGFVHTFNSLIPKSEFAQHPEYFMLRDAKRNPHQLCLTNPDVRRLIIEKTLTGLAASPASRIVEVSPNDGGGTCACDTCKAISDAECSNMGPLLKLVNAVADAVKEPYPDVRVTTLAYLDTIIPPRNLRPRDNVLLWLCTDSHAWEHLLQFVWEREAEELQRPGHVDLFDRALREWHAIGAKMIIWDYPIDYHNYILPLPNMPVVTENMRYYVKHGATGVFQQAQDHPTRGVDRSLMRSWVWAKQMWDLSRPTRPLIRDFNYGFYGRAAEPMQAYDDMLWETWETLHADLVKLREHERKFGPGVGGAFLTAEFVERAMQFFAQAEALAGDNAELQDRIALAKLPILYVKIEQGPGDDTDRYLELVDTFEQTARKHNVTNIKSGLRPPYCDEIIQTWRASVTAAEE